MQCTDGSLNRTASPSVSLVMHPMKMIPAMTVVALLATGCGASEDSSAQPAASPAPDDGYVVQNYTFPPLTATPGESVQVRNGDDEPHTLTATDGSFDTGTFDQSEPGIFSAPTMPGSYDITCQIHPSMRGTLTVR